MENTPLPIVAIIGQPNVGKSTLMNKIAKKPLAVTSPLEGTTRDRQYIDSAWNGAHFTMVDTAGLNLAAKSELEHSLHKQIEIALEEADVLVLVVDGRLNRLSVDDTVLKKFRKIKKPILLALNKLDSPAKWDEKVAEFMSLGLKEIFPISSINGRGIGDLLDSVSKHLKALNLGDVGKEASATIAVSIVGKPNVGKSSLFNAIVKEERVVVSEIPGTTRTAIDSEITFDGHDYTFIDTAGLKKKTYRQETPDIFGGFQTFKAIRRSDVCFLVIDSVEDITKQDQRVANEIFEMEKGVIILANKIDIFNGDREKLRDYISMHFPFLWMAPLFFVSGKTGEGLQEALEAILPIFERRNKKVDAEALKVLLAKKMKINPPKLLRDQKRPMVYSLRQLDINPPKFELLVNHPAAISKQFKKFVENGIIKDLDFWGTPITLKTVGKDKA
jgi:GTP-binding protein